MQVQELSTLSIRPFIADDYAAVARSHNVNFPEFSMDADEWRFEDEHRPPHCRRGRWVADWDGQVVGFGHYDQQPGHYHPRKFQFHVAVDPALYLRGMGRRLYDLVLTELRGLEPVSVDAWSREDMACRVGFFERR